MVSFSNLGYKTQQRVLIIAFLFLPLLLLFTFTLLPALNMFWYSVLDWNGLSKNKEFVGLENYVKIFTRPEYFSVFSVSLYYLLGAFLQLSLALFFATILNFKIRGKGFFKGVLFFSNLLNSVAIGFIFLYFYRPDGTLDSLLRLFGIQSEILWLGNPRIINISLAAASVWRYIGFNFIIFLGTIQSISPEIYDAASIDGADKWQQFRHIIFPSILRIIQLNLILSIKGAISVFEMPYIMTGGGNGSKTFVIQTVDTAFKYNKYGVAAAMGVILLIIVVLITWIQRLLIKTEE